MDRRDAGISGHDKLVIVLSTVLGAVGIAALGLAGLWLARSRRRHRLFSRGLTPIGDEEIETWKVSRTATTTIADDDDDKEAEAYGAGRPSHVSKDSTSSARIQYQKGGFTTGGGSGRPSTETSTVIFATTTSGRGFSIDMPRVPEPAAFARAPNARTGLTDETVPGDDPFVPRLKRQPSRLQKNPPQPMPPAVSSAGASIAASKNPGRAGSRGRTRAGRSQSHPERWRRGGEDESASPAGSRDASMYGAGRHSRIYSSSSIPPQMPSLDVDKETYAGLSPPPSRHREAVIGQALG